MVATENIGSIVFFNKYGKKVLGYGDWNIKDNCDTLGTFSVVHQIILRLRESSKFKHVPYNTLSDNIERVVSDLVTYSKHYRCTIFYTIYNIVITIRTDETVNELKTIYNLH